MSSFHHSDTYMSGAVVARPTGKIIVGKVCSATLRRCLDFYCESKLCHCCLSYSLCHQNLVMVRGMTFPTHTKLLTRQGVNIEYARDVCVVPHPVAKRTHRVAVLPLTVEKNIALSLNATSIHLYNGEDLLCD